VPRPADRTPLSLRPLVVVLLVQLGLAAALIFVAVKGWPVVGREPERARPAAARSPLRADRFDADRAFAELRRQVGLGPRPAGSAASRRLAARLRRALPRGRFERVPGGLRNVVGSLPGRAPALVVAAHYDTKAIPGFVGANDGASGTATLVEVARALRRAHRPAGAPEVRFVLFDGEESPDDARPFYTSGLRGSRAYAQRHGDEVGALVLLDFVGEKGLRIPREEGSDPGLWSRVRAAARRVGAESAFPAGTVPEILDDHTPFARRGVPAVDLIDFTFSCWHRTCDDLHAVSPRSLDLAGETVVELVRSWR
jgi:hypothetical protein